MEEQLDGGFANPGQVVRVGRYVLRPASPHTSSIHAYLRAVRDAGFAGVPTPIGLDPDGRERLEFVEGDVPAAPYPAWAQSDEALASVGRLLRGLHDAAGGFDPSGRAWEPRLADPAGGTTVCHNDAELGNIVFRDGLAVALIDFEFAAPGRAVYDLAHAARLLVPFEDDVDRARMGWRDADHAARTRLLADAYGLDADGRAGLLTAIDDALAVVEAVARRDVEQRGRTALDAMAPMGGIEKYDRRRRWWTAHRPAIAAALG